MRRLIITSVLFTSMAFPFNNSYAGSQEPVVKKIDYADTNVNNVNKLDRKKRRDGSWEFYWDDNNSIVSSSGKFRRGKQVGTWKYYNQQGKLERVEHNKWYTHKIKTQQYHPNGQLQKEGFAKVKVSKEYVDYYWYGDWKCYDENGNYTKTEVYKHGECSNCQD
jgi:antitoxin component YwqK of YwqJK toxin-antitoxin module